MKTSRLLVIALLTASIAIIGALVHCVKPNAGGTETGDVKVAGILYNADGTRAANAVVSIIPAGRNPGAGGDQVIDSVTTTDNTGAYKFAAMPADTYNLLASGSGNLAFRDSLVVKPDTNLVAPACTLRAPGSLSGKVLLQGTDKPTTVMIIVFGTNSWTAPRDSTGAFTLANLAQGSYHVRFLSSLDLYLPLDTTLAIRAGKNDTLAAPITLTYTGIPVPAGLHIQYDTGMQIVNLSWNRPAIRTHVATYNIYRKDADSSDFVKLKGGATDTVYIDTTGVQDHTYQYKVAAMDTNQLEGGRSVGVGVVIATYFKVDTAFGTSGTGPGEFGQLTELTGDSSGTLYVTSNYPSRIQVLNNNLAYQFEIDSPRVLCSLSGIAVDSSENIYAAISYRNGGGVVRKFNSGGILLSEFTAMSQRSGWNSWISDICIHGNNLFIMALSDTGGSNTFDSVIITDLNGNRKRSWPVLHNNRFPFINVRGSNELFMAGDGSIQECDTLGNPGLLIASENLSLRGKVVFDPTGRMIVVQNTTSLWVFNDQGVHIATYKLPKVGSTEFTTEAFGIYAAHSGGNNFVYLDCYIGTNPFLRLKSLLP